MISNIYQQLSTIAVVDGDADDVDDATLRRQLVCLCVR